MLHLAFVGHFVNCDLSMSERRTKENTKLSDGSPGPGTGHWAAAQQAIRFFGREDMSAYNALLKADREAWTVYLYGPGDELVYVLL